MFNKVEPIEILIAAKALVQKGWVQGHLYADANGLATNFNYAACYCLAGAINKATSILTGGHAYSSLEARTEAKFKLRPFIQAAGDEYCGSIVQWNDQPGRTKGEVLALLDMAINA